MPEQFLRTPSVEGRGAGSAMVVIDLVVIVVVVVGVVAGMIVPWWMVALMWNSGCAGYYRYSNGDLTWAVVVVVVVSVGVYKSLLPTRRTIPRRTMCFERHPCRWIPGPVAIVVDVVFEEEARDPHCYHQLYYSS
jgi:hypothetical protein